MDQQPAAERELAGPAADEALVRARTRQRLLDQARAGATRLEVDGRDVVGRGLLGEAAAGLDPLPEWVAAARDRLLVPVQPPTPVRTRRLVLRPFVDEDSEALHRIYGREDVAELLLTPPLAADAAAHEVRRRQQLTAPDDGPPKALWLAAEHQGRLVGDVVLMFEAPHYAQGEIGWVLDPELAGRGLATEAARAVLDLAFDHFGLMRVVAQLDARNSRSAALCERLGMRREAVKRQDFWSKGEWTDSLHYALLAGEHVRG